jgi:hypothetical protein
MVFRHWFAGVRKRLASRNKRVAEKLKRASKPNIRIDHHEDSLIRHLETKLIANNPVKAERFFRSLRQLNKSPRVRVFDFQGQSFIVKRVGLTQQHGRDFHDIQNVLTLHNQEVTRGTIDSDQYTVRLPRVYGFVETHVSGKSEEKKSAYLIMELVPELGPQALAKYNEYGSQRHFARLALTQNLKEIISLGRLRPQTMHIMFLGNTSPDNPAKGKWEFCLPFDID